MDATKDHVRRALLDHLKDADRAVDLHALVSEQQATAWHATPRTVGDAIWDLVEEGALQFTPTRQVRLCEPKRASKSKRSAKSKGTPQDGARPRPPVRA